MQDPSGSSQPRLVQFVEECQCRVSGCGGTISVDWSQSEIDHYPPALGGKVMLIARGHCFKCKQTRVIVKGEEEARQKGILNEDGTLNQPPVEDQKFATA